VFGEQFDVVGAEARLLFELAQRGRTRLFASVETPLGKLPAAVLPLALQGQDLTAPVADDDAHVGSKVRAVGHDERSGSGAATTGCEDETQPQQGEPGVVLRFGSAEGGAAGAATI
jgi:hypothetical protein